MYLKVEIVERERERASILWVTLQVTTVVSPLGARRKALRTSCAALQGMLTEQVAGQQYQLYLYLLCK